MPKSKINVVATLHVLDDKVVVEMSFNTKLAPRHKFDLGLRIADKSNNVDMLAVSDLDSNHQDQILNVVDKIGKLEFIDANEPIVLADSMVAVAIAIAYIEDHDSVNNMVRQIVNTIVSIVNPDYESDDINLSIGLSRSATAEIALDFITSLLCEALEESDEEEASSQDDGESDDAATDE